ncbi:MAG: NAD(P)H-hydrate dehydratase, partial [Clostridia bacterium]|nr:NAD(P)H-hydrate dehydratase [Clostridia bacterium]
VQPAFYSLPEAMVQTCGNSWVRWDKEKLTELIEWADCICAGPGMGKDCEGAIKAVLACAKPAIVDADGLNAIAESDMQYLLHENVIITPHPGEMSRLTGLAVSEIIADPAKTAEEYAKKWNCTVLLKGAQSHIASCDGRVVRNVSGNPGLAKGGSGDVLSGIILALLGQGLKPYDAACAGAYILGVSADRAMDILKERMLMSRDVTEAKEKTLESF